MRKEPHGVGSFVHIIHRGTRGMPIVRDNEDRDRFVLMLTHLNDTYQPENWFRDISSSGTPLFERPDEWPEQEKLVHIIAFCLLDNHFHLLLEEIREGGVSKFMQRLGTAMSYRFNLKYNERGSIFQGSFRSRTVDSDEYLRYVIAYIQLKNVFDVRGIKISSKNDFEEAYAWARHYPYASLGDHIGTCQRPIVEKDFLEEIFSSETFKEFGRNFIQDREKSQGTLDEAICFE
ncbi:MAG TPA: transposase [Candidatus Paceibacterota bacterium]|nr:transposase [Candidatus Paceibacterota bacterium]